MHIFLSIPCGLHLGAKDSALQVGIELGDKF